MAWSRDSWSGCMHSNCSSRRGGVGFGGSTVVVEDGGGKQRHDHDAYR